MIREARGGDEIGNRGTQIPHSGGRTRNFEEKRERKREIGKAMK